MKMRKLTSIILAAAVTVGTLGWNISSNASEMQVTTNYVLTIPETLNVTTAGWNATTGICAQAKELERFSEEKMLTVTAASNNKDTNAAYEWKMVSGTNTVAYKLAAETEKTKTYTEATATTSLNISADYINSGITIPFGVIVEDYSAKPAGEYQDTVTFTVVVADALTP